MWGIGGGGNNEWYQPGVPGGTPALAALSLSALFITLGQLGGDLQKGLVTATGDVAAAAVAAAATAETAAGAAAAGAAAGGGDQSGSGDGVADALSTVAELAAVVGSMLLPPMS